MPADGGKGVFVAGLRIRLFGVLDICNGTRPAPRLPTRRAGTLLSFLILNRRTTHTRDSLAEMLWPDQRPGAARHRLRTELWRLRRSLDASKPPRSTAPLRISPSHVGWDPGSGSWLDVEEFEGVTASMPLEARHRLDGDERRRLERAVELYRGDLLEDVDEEWCLFERERLKHLLVSALNGLVGDCAAREEWAAAIEPCYRLLHQDPLLEPAHRKLMRCYFRLGNRPAAMRQFALCAKLLRTELQVAPMPETVSLYRRIRSG